MTTGSVRPLLRFYFAGRPRKTILNVSEDFKPNFNRGFDL
nr:hypothetical protein [Escherichia coli]